MTLIGCGSKKKVTERTNEKTTIVENVDSTSIKKVDSIRITKSDIKDKIIEIIPDSSGIVTKTEIENVTIITGAKSIKFTNRESRIDEIKQVKTSDSAGVKKEIITKIDTKKRTSNVEKRQFLGGWWWILIIVAIIILLRFTKRSILPGIGIFK